MARTGYPGPLRGLRAMNTSSRPGRSGASRTSSTTKPARARSSSTVGRSRNLSVDREVSVSSSKATVERSLRRIHARHVVPTPGGRIEVAAVGVERVVDAGEPAVREEGVGHGVNLG
jgi:hypothetical protein